MTKTRLCWAWVAVFQWTDSKQHQPGINSTLLCSRKAPKCTRFIHTFMFFLPWNCIVNILITLTSAQCLQGHTCSMCQTSFVNLVISWRDTKALSYDTLICLWFTNVDYLLLIVLSAVLTEGNWVRDDVICLWGSDSVKSMHHIQEEKTLAFNFITCDSCLFFDTCVVFLTM